MRPRSPWYAFQVQTVPTPATSRWPRPKSEDEWEDMVLDAMRARWRDRDAARVGRRGQRQRGVDVCGREGATGQTLGAQAKNRDTLGEIDLAGDIAAAEHFKPALNRYYFVLAGPRDAKLQERIRELSQSREAEGRFSVQVLFFEDVCSDLASNGELVEKYWPGQARVGGLRVVDVQVDDDAPPTSVDIKVRNTSADVCFVKRVDVDVLDVGVLYPLGRPHLQPVTAEYDVDLDPRRPPPYVIGVPVSQVVEGNGTDRFLLRFRYVPEFDWFVHNVIVHVSARLVHNEDDAETEPVPLLFTIRPPYVLSSVRLESASLRAPKAAANRRVYGKMLNLPGTASPTVARMRREVDDARRRHGEATSAVTSEVFSTDPAMPPYDLIKIGTPDSRPPARQVVFERPKR